MTSRPDGPPVIAALSLGRSNLAIGLAIFLVAAAARIAHLDAPPFYDEFYHLLAAASWVEDGSFRILDGAYTRAPLYTILTGWTFTLAGDESVVAARAPNVILGAALAAAAVVWTRTVAGALAGWIVALCVVFWPSGIQLSQTVRFYALHGMLFFIGAVAIYDLCRPQIGPLRRALMLVLALGAFWLAYQFQVSTAVGALAIALWMVVFVILPGILAHPRRNAILAAGAVAAAGALVALFAAGTIQSHWATYTTAPWGRDLTAYHRVLRETYPLLWPITPVLAIFAVRATPRPAWFCLVMVAVALVLHSFAGVQNLRYVYYISPFLFALWGMGLQAVLPDLASALRRALSGALGVVATPASVTAVLVLAGLFAFGTNAAVTRSVKLMLGSVAPPLHDLQAWWPARAPVARVVDAGGIVVATNDLAATYYLGGFDVVFSQNWLPGMDYREFAIDPRTGRPLVSEAASLAAIIQSYPKGAFLAPLEWWAHWPSTNSVPRFLRSMTAENVELAFELAGPVWILHWTTSSLPAGQRYDEIRDIVGRPAAP